MSTPKHSDLPDLNHGLFGGKKFWVSQNVPFRSRYIKDITSNGGRMAPSEKHAEICIIDHAREIPSLGEKVFYSYNLIDESCKRGRLLEIGDYIAKPARSRNNSSKITRSRRPFTKEDDLILLRKLVANPECIYGNKVYEQLALDHPSHTMNSWRARWVKHYATTKGDPKHWLTYLSSGQILHCSRMNKSQEHHETTCGGKEIKNQNSQSSNHAKQAPLRKNVCRWVEEVHKHTPKNAEFDPRHIALEALNGSNSPSDPTSRHSSDTGTSLLSKPTSTKHQLSHDRASKNHSGDSPSHSTPKRARYALENDFDLTIPPIESSSISDNTLSSINISESQEVEELKRFVPSLQKRYNCGVEKVVWAMIRTSASKKLMELVLDADQRGESLPDVPGVWREEDDEILGGGDSKKIVRLSKEKGDWNERLEFLTNWMSA